MHAIPQPAGALEDDGSGGTTSATALSRLCVAPFLAACPEKTTRVLLLLAVRCARRVWLLLAALCASCPALPCPALPGRRARVHQSCPPFPSTPRNSNSQPHETPLAFFSATLHTLPSPSPPSPSVIRQALFPHTRSIPAVVPARALLTIALLPAVHPRIHLCAQVPY
ncbi:hypothetical protein K505DRAFT_96482 [Melanomma pulvis-pyrius CBS 109.77]|uniref:Uncharacterized protein n=1 Tax=Melanomma pulvis-pyrius CBS 109.77 TaxID=1314802 RepID=A0A6A6WYS6_9PLEO|nr:hypothetical protein K505DRAFT_96482 [Melanomma pulvis-pyrius CBS 109.77]